MKILVACLWFVIARAAIPNSCLSPIDFSSTNQNSTVESAQVCSNNGICVAGVCQCNSTWFDPICTKRCPATLPTGAACEPSSLRYYPCPYSPTLGYRNCSTNSSIRYCGRDSSPELTYNRPYAYASDTQTAPLCWAANTAYRQCVNTGIICSGSPCIDGSCECDPFQTGIACQLPNCYQTGSSEICSNAGFCLLQTGCSCFKAKTGRFCEFERGSGGPEAIPIIVGIVVGIVILVLCVVACLAIVDCCNRRSKGKSDFDL